ncbi:MULTISPECIES: ABC transporter ATP-binding protein [unclassified Streptomyces]|uniref:ABC transporter ATP-binding protein n=1 Tax=unclassified Streptomyces TaxID=2593676 RepID=UPI0024A895BD|nr:MULTISPECIES: ABC transporter ATP-binding protein [unclassified Streptomyces]
MSLPPPVIEFRGVGRVYPGSAPVEALLPCDLTVGRGEFVTIIGPSGAGKSTFLNIVGLLDRHTSGAYLLDGVDTGPLRDADRTALRGRRVGFVFQSFHLLPHRTVCENVELALVYRGVSKVERTAEARRVLLRVGLGERMHALPTTLSGGERQRAAIARALVGGPSLLLCDEPTGNLDTSTADSILELFQELHDQGMTILLITHDPTVAGRGSRTLEIRDGLMTEQVRV